MSVARFRIAAVTQELKDETGERRFDTLLGLSFLLLVMVAGPACWIPSGGAARIDPGRALRLD